MSKEIILFYKVLEAPGGAERLLLHEYYEFKKQGFRVYVVTYSYNPEAFFSAMIDAEDLIVFDAHPIICLLKLRQFLQAHKGAIVLGSSGHLDLYLATRLTALEYSLHVHHPSFMSFNEYDKYSVFQNKHFDEMLSSNYGAIRFKEIKNSLSFFQRIKINVRAAVSILSIKTAKNIFVLSELAKKEKKKLFGVDAHVVCGALENSVIEQKQFNKISGFQHYGVKLLTIARLDKNKRIDVLLEAFALYLEEKPDSYLVIGGEGEEKTGLIKLANQLGISDKVEFAGFIPDEKLYDYYSSADLFVSIDWADYRITAYEAMATGTKVLLSNETDYGKELQSSGYLTLVEPTTKNTLDGIRSSIENEPEISFEQLKLHLRELTWGTFCKKLMAYLQ